MKSGLSFVLGALCATFGYADSLKSQSVLGFEDFASGNISYGDATITSTDRYVASQLCTEYTLNNAFFNDTSASSSTFSTSITMLLDLEAFYGKTRSTMIDIVSIGNANYKSSIMIKNVSGNTKSFRFCGADYENSTFEYASPQATGFTNEGKLAISLTIGDLTLSNSSTPVTSLHTWLVGSDSVSTINLDTALGEGFPSLNTLLVNNYFSDAIEQVYVHDFALSANQVQTLMYEMTGNVPEPATSSLALFGLAALLFRRQRGR